MAPKNNKFDPQNPLMEIVQVYGKDYFWSYKYFQDHLDRDGVEAKHRLHSQFMRRLRSESWDLYLEKEDVIELHWIKSGKIRDKKTGILHEISEFPPIILEMFRKSAFNPIILIDASVSIIFIKGAQMIVHSNDPWFQYTCEFLANHKTNKAIENKFIYFIQSTKTYSIKIGVTSNLSSRIDNIERTHGYDLKILYSVQLKNAYKYEKILHEHWKGQRLNGEWFYLKGSMTANRFVTVSKSIISKERRKSHAPF